jgi:hypothetical protein
MLQTLNLNRENNEILIILDRIVFLEGPINI